MSFTAVKSKLKTYIAAMISNYWLSERKGNKLYFIVKRIINN